MAQELIEKLVTQWLPEAEVDFLTDKCTEFQIVVPPQKAASSQYLQKLILRHLTSEDLENSADQGQGVWSKMFSELGLVLKKGDSKATGVVKSEPVSTSPAHQNDDDSDNVSGGSSGGGGGKGKGKADANGSGNPVQVDANVSAGSVVSYHKLREFKISGTVDAGKPGTLQYVSLLSQISLGKSAKYTTPEIIYGVIRACPTASNFRTLLESNLTMDIVEFEKLLRSHFRQQSSDDILLKLKSLFQEPDQTAYEFCCKAMSLRDNLAKTSLEEGDPWEDLRLKRRLMRTISTGLKQNSVRLELQPYLSETSTLTDWDFLDKVSAAEIHEDERLGKVKEKEAAIALLSSKNKNSDSSSKAKSCAPAAKSSPDLSAELKTFTASVNSLNVKIDHLTTNSANQGKRIAELEDLLAQTLGSSGGNNVSHGNQNNSQSNRRVFKCQNCTAQNVRFCDHCFKCNESGHKKSDCPN